MPQQTRVVFYREKSGRVPMQRWLNRLPEIPRRKCEELIAQLQESGRQLTYPHAHPLREGIHELLARHGTVRYRILYFWHGSTVAVITHGIVKKNRAVPGNEIQLALRRKRDFEQDPVTHTGDLIMPEKTTFPDGIVATPRLGFDRNLKSIPVLDERLKLRIAEHIYALRDSTKLTQKEFAKLVDVEPSVVDDLEEWDYEGDTLAMLAHIEKALRRHVEAPIKPAANLYPNALLTATITGLKLRLFRYHIGRKTTHVKNNGFDPKTPQRKQYLLNGLEPWQEALERNRQELRMFALAEMTEWCHLDGGLRGNFSGSPNEYIQASLVHNQLIEALIHTVQTGERTALKQWRQNMAIKEETRYINELKTALQQKIFQEFPDIEWLVQALLDFLKMPLEEDSDPVSL